ncbi:phospholipase A1 member A-like [Ctenocephalides felis]|uniref:phospholipase A1 member A-like n=1 Tax=Ctenocephalides felis TaxID=7515 RepID=UPI000E6E2174|nr:phospholipase A1 member A-like [Ctenocephalides felis]
MPRSAPDGAPLEAYLYNNEYEGLPLTPEIWEEIEIPSCHDIRFVLHGYHQTRLDVMSIIKAYQGRENTSAIVLDWEPTASLNYNQAKSTLYNVAISLRSLLTITSEYTGKKLSDFHIVAFGLGAQLAATLGRMVDGEIGMIIGLDPTISGWNEDKKEDRENMLNKDCAKFVRIIHTDGERYGVRYPMGHADFYMNGGFYQPGCKEDDELCAHLRAIDYMAEAIEKNRMHIGFRCASWYDLRYNGECRIVPNRHSMYVSNEAARCPEEYEEGIFYAATNARPPYSLFPPHYIYVANDVVHVSHTTGVYGSDWPIPVHCNSKETPGDNSILKKSQNANCNG